MNANERSSPTAKIIIGFCATQSRGRTDEFFLPSVLRWRASLGAVAGLTKSRNISQDNRHYAEKQEFYKRVKAAIDLEYYTKYGLDEYDFDIFLAYADEQKVYPKITETI